MPKHLKLYVLHEVMQLLMQFLLFTFNMKAVKITQTYNMVQASPNGSWHCQNWVYPVIESVVGLSLVSHLQIFD